VPGAPQGVVARCDGHLLRRAAEGLPDAYRALPRIVIPPLGARKTELDRLIREYLREAAALLGGTKHVRLSPADRAWLRTSASASLSELRTATLRLVAVRVAKDVQAASTLLGISHVALRKWLNDRGFSKLEAAGARAARRSGPRRGAGQDRRQLGRRR